LNVHLASSSLFAVFASTKHENLAVQISILSLAPKRVLVAAIPPGVSAVAAIVAVDVVPTAAIMCP
jgi:hypothetical protein